MRDAFKNSFVYACFALLGLYMATYQSMVDEMAAELGLNVALMGVIVSMHFVGSMLAPPLMGRISDARGAKPAVLSAMGLIVAGLLCLCLGRGRVMATAGILVVGCGYAASEGLLTSALAVMNPERVESVVGRSQMWFCAGAVVGPYASELLAGFGGWRACDAVLCALFAAGFVALAFTPLKNVPPAPKEEKLRLWRAPALLMLCASIALYVGVEQGAAFFMSSYYEELGAGELARYSLSAYWAGMCVGRMAMSLIKKRFALYAGVTLALAALLLPLALLAGGAVVAVLLFAATGFLLAAAWPTLAALAAKRYAAHSGTATGCMMTAGAVGGALFPSVMGALASGAGVGASMLLLPAMIIPSIVLMAVSQRSRA